MLPTVADHLWQIPDSMLPSGALPIPFAGMLSAMWGFNQNTDYSWDIG